MIRVIAGLGTATLVATFLGCGILSAATCQPEPAALTNVAAADLVGTYTGTDHASVTLSADGKLTMDIVTDAFADDGHVTGVGTWRLRDPAPVQSSRPMQIDIELPDYVTASKQHGLATSLNVGGTKDDPTLWFTYGDPDACDYRQLTRAAPRQTPSR